MVAYVIAEHEVFDLELYEQARPGAGAAIAAYGGKYLVSGTGATELIEGDQPPRRIVLLEFPDTKSARAFYTSPEYRAARAIRQSSARSRLILAEGVLST